MLARLPALALVGLLVLTGCSDDPEVDAGPASESPASTSASAPVEPETSGPTSEPTSTQTVDPAEESAEEFIRRFQAASYEMQNTGETAAFLGMTFQCKACDSFARDVDQVYEDGGSASFDGGRVVALRQVGATPGGTYIFDYAVISGRGEIRDRDGKVVRDFKGGREPYQINVRKRSGEWSVTELTARSS